MSQREVSRQSHRWWAFALRGVTYLITAIDLTIVNVSLPTIGRDLHFSSTSLQWVLGVIALLAPPAVFALMRGERARSAAAASKNAEASRALASTD
jgi:MFS family permease